MSKVNDETTVVEDKVADKGKHNTNTSVVKTETSTPVIKNDSMTSINLFDPAQLVAAENFLKRILRSEKGGIKSVEDGLAIVMRAKDLQLPFSACIEHVHVISGKTGVDIHIIKALLSRAGVTWDCVKDYTPLYEYTDGINVYIDGKFPDYVRRCRSSKEANEKNGAASNDDEIYVYPVKWYKDLQGNIYKEYQLSQSKFGVAVTRQQIAEISKEGKIPVYRIPNNPVDYITEYKLFRKVGDKEVTAIGHFSYSEAVAAGMLDKDTYQKYARILIGHRAFTYAARDIASDVLFGVMETTELKIVAGKDLDDADVEEIKAEEVN